MECVTVSVLYLEFIFLPTASLVISCNVDITKPLEFDEYDETVRQTSILSYEVFCDAASHYILECQSHIGFTVIVNFKTFYYSKDIV